MDGLRAAIESLYSAFSKYTTEGIEHCDCGCINEEDVRKLSSKPLRQLEEDDLVSYHGSALYTWGDIEHYKHYLPRFCELLSQNRNFAFIELSEIFVKLDYAKWTEWPEEEQQAIKDYVLMDWVQLANKENSEINDRVLRDYGKFLDMEKMVRLWDIASTEMSLRNFVSFFYYHGSQILNGGLRISDKKYDREFFKLIEDRKLLHKLEASFFENETRDPGYADITSVVLQMIEQEMRTRRSTNDGSL